jgi:hypothetical protein
MWDLSGGKFRLPHVPLFSWEELGKMDPSVLRTLRHLYFSTYEPSADGAYWLADKGDFDMHLTEDGKTSDLPDAVKAPLKEEELPDMLKGINEPKTTTIEDEKKFEVNNVSLTELMTLQGMEEDVAVEMKEVIDEKEITTFDKLKEYISATAQQLELWAKSFKN